MASSKRRLVLVATLGALLAPALFAAGVKTSHSPDADFGEYRTYAWRVRDATDPKHPLAEGSELDLGIKAKADERFARLGLERVDDPGAADLVVSYTGYVKDFFEVEGLSVELGENVKWIGSPYAHSSRAYKEGTLVVEITDVAADKLVWSGWVSQLAADTERLRKKAIKATGRILQNYPPGP